MQRGGAGAGNAPSLLRRASLSFVLLREGFAAGQGMANRGADGRGRGDCRLKRLFFLASLCWTLGGGGKTGAAASSGPGGFQEELNPDSTLLIGTDGASLSFMTDTLPFFYANATLPVGSRELCERLRRNSPSVVGSFSLVRCWPLGFSLCLFAGPAFGLSERSGVALCKLFAEGKKSPHEESPNLCGSRFDGAPSHSRLSKICTLQTGCVPPSLPRRLRIPWASF